MTKPLWIFVAGTYRSGSTTHYEITRSIVEDTKNGVGIGYHTEERLQHYDTTNHKMIVCKVFAPLWLHYYDTHDDLKPKPSYGRKIYDEARMKAVVSIRDPRDILTSMKKREQAKKGRDWYKDAIDTATNKFPLWLGDVEKWCNLFGVTYWSKFEVFTQDLPGEVQRIAKHLDIILTVKQAEDIASRFTIDALNKRRGEYNKPDDNRHLPSVPGIVFGTSGQWRQWLTDEEVEAVEKVNGDFMRRFGYE